MTRPRLQEKLNTPVTILLTVIVVALWCTNGALADLHRDFVHCLERGDCAFEGVCGFSLKADRSHCFMDSCIDIEGQLMSVRNGLDRAVNVTWNVVGHEVGDVIKEKRTILLGAMTTRYFDTRLPANETHSISLNIDTQTVAVVLVNGNLECTPDEACDYLLHACYGIEDEEGWCTEYARHCHGFTKVDEERRQACIPSCLDTYYGHFFQNQSPYTAYDSDLLVAMLLEMRRRDINLSEYSAIESNDDNDSNNSSPSTTRSPTDTDLDEALNTEFDICALTKCNDEFGVDGIRCSQNQSISTGIVILAIVLVVLLIGLGWLVFRRFRANYQHGSTNQYL